MFFAVKHPESFISCRLSSFCLRLQLVIYSHQVFACVRFAYRVWPKKKKEKSPWLKTKKKTGPKKKKKKVSDELRMAQNSCRNPIAHKPRYNNRYIEFFEALSLPTYCAQRWPPGCGWKYLHQTCKAEKLGYWTASLRRQFIRMDNVILYINSPSTYPSDRISACSCFFRIDGAHRWGHCSFPFLRWIFSAQHFVRKSEKLRLVIELQSRTQLFRRDTSNLRGLRSRSPVILLAFDVGGIRSVEILRSKGVKCL